MPEIKPSTVVLILAVFACVALYVLGLGLGATDNFRAGRTSTLTAEFQRLRDRFMKPRPVKPEELQADCTLTSGVLAVPQGSSCRVTIKEAGARGRTVEVAPASGSVSLNFTPKTQPGLPVSEDPLKGSKKLDVMKEGGELNIKCLSAVSGGLCQVRLQ
ncbi:MAG: hypothetical protein ACJ8AT_11335 [Hyalangium sp.]|uniref:hypothetical protein n=1 Tax=Hyalangium sp. TaxID=2028555 RepID=UPI003899C12A